MGLGMDDDNRLPLSEEERAEILKGFKKMCARRKKLDSALSKLDEDLAGTFGVLYYFSDSKGKEEIVDIMKEHMVPDGLVELFEEVEKALMGSARPN